jgi:hypothetical protein
MGFLYHFCVLLMRCLTTYLMVCCAVIIGRRWRFYLQTSRIWSSKQPAHTRCVFVRYDTCWAVCSCTNPEDEVRRTMCRVRPEYLRACLPMRISLSTVASAVNACKRVLGRIFERPVGSEVRCDIQDAVAVVGF